MPFSKWLGLRYQVFISLELIARKVLCLVFMYVCMYTHVYIHTYMNTIAGID